MKFRVIFEDQAYASTPETVDPWITLEGTKEFNDPYNSSDEPDNFDNEDLLDRIATVVSEFESTYGICVDQGGEPNWYECTMVEPSDRGGDAKLAAKLLKDLEATIQ